MGAAVAFVLGVLLFILGVTITRETTIPDLSLLGLIMVIVGIALAVAGFVTLVAGVLF